ncbi:hypothetical protein [Cellulomonas sp. NS3]|uniref:hypothetical protein n=1 Tax=Cellulomonas sp. NS3 TaxID=2973977 RepID=UPI002162C015|nr:hypothetical protein [Cellulomonas sp. NS3]
MLRRVAGVDGVAELDVLDRPEAQEIADRVQALRTAWCRRSPRVEFYTLGGNAYMDLAGSSEATYVASARRGNAVLDEHFHALYERLADRLGTALGLTARYPDDLARPGFHIWLGTGIPLGPHASVHFDLQYLGIIARPAYRACSGTVSFTVPIALPANGSGLNVWPGCGYPASPSQIRAVSQGPPVVIGYRTGTAVVHSGHVLHQIGATPEPGADDVRLTLQGHGLVRGSDLVLYW